MHYRVGYDRYIIIAILVASVLHANRCAPDGEPTAAAAEADGQSQSSSGLSALVSKTMSEVSHIGSEVTTATEETLKVVGRLSVAAANLFMKLLDGASHTTAAAGNALATGVKQVNKFTGPVPMLGTVTTGVQNVVVGVTDTFSENSKFNIARRNQLAQEWLGQVNSFTPGTANPAAGAQTTPAK